MGGVPTSIPPVILDLVIFKIFYLLHVWQVICFTNIENHLFPTAIELVWRWDSMNEHHLHFTLPGARLPIWFSHLPSSHLHEYECILGHSYLAFDILEWNFILINFQEDQWLYSGTGWQIRPADGFPRALFSVFVNNRVWKRIPLLVPSAFSANQNIFSLWG